MACLPPCGRCCQWNMSSPSKANQKVRPSEIRTTEKYPTTVHEGSPSHLLCREVPVTHMTPVEQSFEWLLCALRFAAHNMLHDKWNKGVTSSYLKSCAVPDRVIDTMQKHVKNNAQHRMQTLLILRTTRNIGYLTFGGRSWELVPGSMLACITYSMVL